MSEVIQAGSYKATVKPIHGEFQVTVLCMSGTHAGGDVLFLKSYTSQSRALTAAKRAIAKYST
jgi:hypothetical protein